MPIVIFIGISSVGAVFMVLFFAALCRDQRRPVSETFTTHPSWLTRGSALRPPSVVKIVGPEMPRTGTASAVIVLTPRRKPAPMTHTVRDQRTAVHEAPLNISVKN